MKYIKKTAMLIIAVLVILLLPSCSGIKLDDNMKAGIDSYISAVEKSEKRPAGNVTVVSTCEDNAIEFKNTESVIECSYEVRDGKVIYSRSDTLNDKLAGEYESDGTKVMYREAGSSEWVDKTEENKKFLSQETNPLTTLSLFRVDSKHKVNTDYITDIKYNSVPDENGLTSVEFTLKDSTVSDVLSYSKVKGIVRSSAGHVRTYYIDGDGYISRITVSTVQIIFNNGKEGSYRTDMTVTCK